ncbi:MAG: protease modulator HflC [Candidatus Tectomicrobia bacterium]|nr:protease modulator HflC [Candidatus Tectomicrobia bacterium]
MLRRPGIIISIVIILLLLVNSVTFSVDEREQAVVTQFGRFVRALREAGLHVKIPLIQKVTILDRRLMEYESAPTNIITKDKKTLVVDNYVRWRISDPRRFIETVRNEMGAQARLDDIVYSELRVELARHDLSEIISAQRAKIMRLVTERSREKSETYGIEVNDVRIKRADLPPENERAVFGRMRAERIREAKRYRSEGEEEAAKIRAETDKDKTIILADAYEQEQKVRGGGDAKAVAIYAEAYLQDAEFFAFMRSLEAYRNTLKKNATVVLPANDPFLRYLRSGGKENAK